MLKPLVLCIILLVADGSCRKSDVLNDYQCLTSIVFKNCTYALRNIACRKMFESDFYKRMCETQKMSGVKENNNTFYSVRGPYSTDSLLNFDRDDNIVESLSTTELDPIWYTTDQEKTTQGQTFMTDSITSEFGSHTLESHTTDTDGPEKTISTGDSTYESDSSINFNPTTHAATTNADWTPDPTIKPTTNNDDSNHSRSWSSWTIGLVAFTSVFTISILTVCSYNLGKIRERSKQFLSEDLEPPNVVVIPRARINTDYA